MLVEFRPDFPVATDFFEGDGVLDPDQLGAGGFDGDENAELVRAEVFIGWSEIVLGEVN